MAIGFRTVAVVSPRDDDRAVFYSANYGQEASFATSSLAREPRGHWSDSRAGVSWSLPRDGIAISGFNVSLAGDVPLGEKWLPPWHCLDTLQ
jgi:galactokinase